MVSGSLTEWFSHEPIKGYDPREAAEDPKKGRLAVQALSTHCLEEIHKPGFGESIDLQVYVVGFFMAFYKDFLDLLKPLEEPFSTIMRSMSRIR